MRLSGPCRIQSIYINAISGRWSELYLHINGEHLHEHANGNIPDRVNIQFPFFRVPPYCLHQWKTIYQFLTCIYCSLKYFQLKFSNE